MPMACFIPIPRHVMSKGEGIKILPNPKNKFCRDYQYCFSAQVQAGNTSKNLLSEIRQIVYSFKQKIFLKKVYYN